MDRITRKLWSHESVDSGDRYFVGDVRKSRPKIVHTFPDLLEIVARVSYHNSNQTLFYRGQSKEHATKEDGTSIYPTILRTSKRGSKAAKRGLDSRYQALSTAEEFLIKEFRKNNVEGFGKIKLFREIRWAIIQHYEMAATPLLDLTTSLRVACSFALNGINEHGIVYVLGLPIPNGNISYYVEDKLLNIRLLSICPPAALRPHYQEGYMAGTFPDRSPPNLSSNQDFARRLVAKFKIPTAGFWSKDFPPIPDAALYPANDRIERICGNGKGRRKP